MSRAVGHAIGEPVLQQAGGRWFMLSECDEAIANIPRRKNPELFTQAPGASSIVRDGHDGGERIKVDAGSADFNEPPQNDWQPGAPTKRGDPYLVVRRSRKRRKSRAALSARGRAPLDAGVRHRTAQRQPRCQSMPAESGEMRTSIRLVCQRTP